MGIYYSINDVLDQMDQQEGNRFDRLIPVNRQISDCNVPPEDVFVLSSFPKLLDLTKTESAHLLAGLIEDIPLYSINMELILDQALAERHTNTRIAHALNQAFHGHPLPNTLKPDSGPDDEDFSGGLQHPMLAHRNKLELSMLYIEFLGALDREQGNYNFEKNILGKHVNGFAERFDGFITPHDGKIKAEILLGFGARQDHDPGKPMETHVQNGLKQARKMNISEPHELVWAWLEADNYQMRRCLDLDRIMRLEGLPKTPNWVKTDIFCCLEKEAMKQYFSEILVQTDPALPFLKNCQILQRAIRNNAEGHVDEALQQLLTQTLSQGTGYAGAAEKFVTQAERRAVEAKLF